MENAYEVARPLTADELPEWLLLAEALAENRLPVMGLGCHVIGRLARTRRGRAAQPGVGRISIAVAATLCIPDPTCFEVIRSAVVPLTDAGLDAYEELLREVRPIVHEVVVAERLRRSGALAAPWHFTCPEGLPLTAENIGVTVRTVPGFLA